MKEFKTSPQDFWLVLTDIRTPKMDSIELARERMRVSPCLPMVLMTAFNIEGGILTSLPAMKEEGVVKKPSNPSDLCSAVRVKLQKNDAAIRTKVNNTF